MGRLTRYPANATMLREDQIPRGVYIACSGRSKLSVEARDRKTIILCPNDRIVARNGNRLFSDMKRKDLIRLEGAMLVIPNRIALQAIAA